MTLTYGDITVQSIVDGELITERLVINYPGGPDIQLVTASGGRRTERADTPADVVTLQHLADPTLVDVPDEDLDAFAVAVHAGIGVVPVAWQIEAQHGVALEMNRRRALACIARKCVCHGGPAIQVDDTENECPGHYDDDHALLHGEYYCDGTCQS